MKTLNFIAYCVSQLDKCLGDFDGFKPEINFSKLWVAAESEESLFEPVNELVEEGIDFNGNEVSANLILPEVWVHLRPRTKNSEIEFQVSLTFVEPLEDHGEISYLWNLGEEFELNYPITVDGRRTTIGLELARILIMHGCPTELNSLDFVL